MLHPFHRLFASRFKSVLFTCCLALAVSSIAYASAEGTTSAHTIAQTFLWIAVILIKFSRAYWPAICVRRVGDWCYYGQPCVNRVGCV